MTKEHHLYDTRSLSAITPTVRGDPSLPKKTTTKKKNNRDSQSSGSNDGRETVPKLKTVDTGPGKSIDDRKVETSPSRDEQMINRETSKGKILSDSVSCPWQVFKTRSIFKV